jgi:translation initiation factor 2 alpha subunit (eIF-2alpha)
MITMPSYFYATRTPAVGETVVATVQQIKDVAVYATLPAYGDCEVMLPTSEINVRRGKRVSDYVRVGQDIAVAVIRDEGDKFDVSMKQVREVERDAIMEKYHRDSKVALLVRTAATDPTVSVDALYRDVVWPLIEWLEEEQEDEDGPHDVLAVFEAVRGGDAAPVAIPPALHAAIMQKLPAPTWREEAEFMMRFGTFHDGAARVAATLTRLSQMPGIEVHVVAPPKYRLVATATTKAEAAALLAAAQATIPDPV